MNKLSVTELLMLIFMIVLFVSLLGTVIISTFITIAWIINLGMLLTTIAFLGVCTIIAIDK